MIKKILIFIITSTPLLLYSQAKTDNKKVEAVIKSAIPVQSQYSNNFTINRVYFNKRIDWGGKGDILEVEFQIKNMIDDPQDLYVFIVATYETDWKRRKSFQLPVPEKNRVRSFVPFPDDIKNFEYPDVDSKGNVKKNRKGEDKIKYVKFPKNTKSGVNPNTGKTYHLTNDMIIRSTHLSRYRNNYFFFNQVALLIFDSNGKPAFRQLYDLKGYRR